MLFDAGSAACSGHQHVSCFQHAAGHLPQQFQLHPEQGLVEGAGCSGYWNCPKWLIRSGN